MNYIGLHIISSKGILVHNFTKLTRGLYVMITIYNSNLSKELEHTSALILHYKVWRKPFKTIMELRWICGVN